MHRWKTPVLCGLAFALAAWAYHGATQLAMALVWMPPPAWWNPPVSRFMAAISWLHVVHGIGMVAASLPFALALRLVPLRRPVALAFALGIVALVLPNLWLLSFSLASLSPQMQASTTIDLARFLLVLPLLTWLLFKVRHQPPAPPAWAFAG